MTIPEGFKSIKLGDLVTETNIKSLRAYVAAGRRQEYLTPSVHGLVMKWLALNPAVTRRMEEHGVVPEYGAYLLEYYLQLK